MIDSPTIATASNLATCYPGTCLLNYVRYVVNGAEGKRSVTAKKMSVGDYLSWGLERGEYEEDITQITE
jgi:hypothetical protein